MFLIDRFKDDVFPDAEIEVSVRSDDHLGVCLKDSDDFVIARLDSAKVKRLIEALEHGLSKIQENK